jgi:RsmE family RNA methyltransferase
MNLILLHPHEIVSGRVFLKDFRADHIRNVLKSVTGDTLRAGVVNGMTGTALVEDISPACVVLGFTAESAPPKAPDVTLIISLPRPKVFRRVLFGAVSCGVKDIHVINSWRVDKSYWDSPYIGAESVERVCLEALSQARDTVMPSVSFCRYFMEFIENVLPAIPAERRRFTAHPTGGETMPCVPCALAVGPEGGFIDKEIKTFADKEFELFSTGGRILTTEHFVPFILGSVLK